MTFSKEGAIGHHLTVPSADPLLKDDPALPPDAWRCGSTRLRIRWQWLERLQFTAEGHVGALCGWDKTLRVWDPRTGSALAVHVAPNQEESGGEEGYLAKPEPQGTLAVIRRADGQVIGRVNAGHVGDARCAVSPDGVLLAIGAFMAPAIRVFELPTGRELSALNAPRHHVKRMVETKHGPVSLDAEGVLRLHHPQTGAVLASSSRDWWDVRLAGEGLVATTRDAALGTLELPSLRGEPGAGGVAIRLLAVTGDRAVVVGHRNDLAPGPRQPSVLEERRLDGSVVAARTLDSPGWAWAEPAVNGVVACVQYRALALYDLASLSLPTVAEWEDPPSSWALSGAVAHAQGSWFVGACDGRVGVLRPGAQTLRAALPLGAPAVATALCTLPDDRLAVGYDDGRVRVWDLRSEHVVVEWALHLGRVSALILCEGFLVSASEDTTLVGVPLNRERQA